MSAQYRLQSTCKSTMARSRSRSRSPARHESRKKREPRGMKWKDTTVSSSRDKDDEERHERRERKKHRDGKEGRKEADAERNFETNALTDSKPAEPEVPSAQSADDLKIASKFGAAAAAKVKPIKLSNDTSAPEGMTITSSSSRNGASAGSLKSKVPTGPMMLVTINDRLGTKKEVPCLGSDTVGDFKKLVAMQIGRKPHEIMLKRQSERPLKDQLTLDDYEISNGVQLDLELNTGD